jgi:hypothetical protein
MSGHARALDVLVASMDRDFLRFARTVLRSAGHQVGSTTVCSERISGQIRLRRPHVVLLDADRAVVDGVRTAVAAGGTRVLRLSDEPELDAVMERPPPVHKWAPPTTLRAVVGAARAAARAEPGPATLRLVQP